MLCICVSALCCSGKTALTTVPSSLYLKESKFIFYLVGANIGLGINVPTVTEELSANQVVVSSTCHLSGSPSLLKLQQPRRTQGSVRQTASRG